MASNPRRRMYLRMITSSFWNRLSRAIIASLSIAVGAATLSGLGIVAFTVPDQMARELRSYGANLVVLPESDAALTETTLEEVDRVLADTNADVVGRAPYRYANLLYNMQPLQVMGTDVASAASIRPYWNVDGKLPGEGELLVGTSVAQRFRFDVGDRIGLAPPGKEGEDVGGSRFLTVSGTVRTGGPEDDLVIMSSDDLAGFGSGEVTFDVLEYSVNAKAEGLTERAGAINAALTDVDAEVVRRIAQSESGIAQTLQSLIWLVSIIISALTLISVSTTLLTIVNERAREIGLKKALGAQTRDIAGEFVGEAVILGLVGGSLGLVAGIGMAGIVTRQAFGMDLSVSPWLVPITLALSTVISVLGSLIPARRIARIQPSMVLGGE